MSSTSTRAIDPSGSSLSNPNLAGLIHNANTLESSLLYKTVRAGEKNHLAQRIGIEVVGVDLFTILCELVLRGWKAAAGAGLRISLFVINSAIIPTVIIPGLNFIARKKFGLPDGFRKLFYNQFADLIPEKKNEKSNIDFLKSVEELDYFVTKYLRNIEGIKKLKERELSLGIKE